MFGDDQRLRLGQIKHLPRRVTLLRHLPRQRRAAFGAGRGEMIFDVVGLGYLPQRLARVALLPARLPLGFLAQAAHPRRPLQPVARRRLAAVRTVQAEPALKFGDPRLQSRVFGHQRRDLRRLRPDQRNQLFPRRLARRFDNHPILESETEAAVQKISSPTRDRNHQTWAVTIEEGLALLFVESTLKGYTVEASDGKIGVVRDFLFDDQSWKIRWLVLDAGSWLPRRKFCSIRRRLRCRSACGNRSP